MSAENMSTIQLFYIFKLWTSRSTETAAFRGRRIHAISDVMKENCKWKIIWIPFFCIYYFTFSLIRLAVKCIYVRCIFKCQIVKCITRKTNNRCTNAGRSVCSFVIVFSCRALASRVLSPLFHVSAAKTSVGRSQGKTHVSEQMKKLWLCGSQFNRRQMNRIRGARKYILQALWNRMPGHQMNWQSPSDKLSAHSHNSN